MELMGSTAAHWDEWKCGLTVATIIGLEPASVWAEVKRDIIELHGDIWKKSLILLNKGEYIFSRTHVLFSEESPIQETRDILLFSESPFGKRTVWGPGRVRLCYDHSSSGQAPILCRIFHPYWRQLFSGHTIHVFWIWDEFLSLSVCMDGFMAQRSVSNCVSWSWGVRS